MISLIKNISCSILFLALLSTSTTIKAQWIAHPEYDTIFGLEIEEILYPSENLIMFSSLSSSYYSTDEGKNWRQPQHKLGGAMHFRISDIRDKKHGYVTYGQSGYWLYYTADSGKTLLEVNDRDLLGSIAVSSPSPKYVFVSVPDQFGYAGRIWYSLDSTYYRPVNIGNAPINYMSFQSAGIGCFHDQDHIYRTADTLKTWDTVYTKTSGDQLRQFHFFDQNNGYCLSRTRILKTADGGKTWTTPKELSFSDYIKDMYFQDLNTGAILTTNGVEYTYNGGKTWTLIPKGPEYPRNPLTLGFLDSNHIIVGSDFGTYSSLDPSFVPISGNTIDSKTEKSKYTVYPSPASNNIAIKAELADFPLSLSISSLKGDIVLSGSIEMGGKIDVSKLPPGYYQLFIKSVNDETSIAPLLISR